MKKVAEVFETKKYDLFKIMEGNRDLRKIEELEKRMINTQGYPFYTPIIINEEYEIVDGQHRYFLCKRNNLPIQFIFIKNVGIEGVININITNNKWVLSDYFKSYADRGNGYYKMIYNLKTKDTIGLSEIGILSLTTTDGKIYSEKVIKEGKLVFNIVDAWNNWYNNYEKYVDVVNVLKSQNKTGYIQKYCITSLVTMFNNEHYNHEHFLKQLEKYSGMFKTSVYSKKYFLEIFEDIYNYNSRKRPIRLF